MLWLLRISLVGLAAAAMSLVGLAWLPDVSLGSGGSAGVALLSVVLWLGLCPLVYRQSLGLAVSVGLLSPLLATVPWSPLLVFALFLDVRSWLVFLTGALTGVLVRACLSIGQARGRGKPKPVAGPERGFLSVCRYCRRIPRWVVLDGSWAR